MPYQIVTVSVSQELSATPNNLQQRGAIPSFGSLMLPKSSATLMQSRAEIVEYLRNDIASLQATYTPAETVTKAKSKASETEEQLNALDGESRAADETTYVLSVAGGRTFNQAVGENVNITISGCLPAEWNETVTATVSAPGELTWSVGGEQRTGSPTVLGYFTIAGVDVIEAALTTFYAQRDGVAVYLLELGQQNSVSGQVQALSEWINDPVGGPMYAYCVPPAWDGDAGFIQMASENANEEAMVYFFIVTAKPQNNSYESPYNGIKSIVCVTDETSPATNSSAAFMALVVGTRPSAVAKVAPFAFRYVTGLTASEQRQSVTTVLTAQNVNFIQSAAEGGISNICIYLGVASDGHDFLYWYSADWMQINIKLALANTVINGSNTPSNPLYFDQDGIDRLQNAAQLVVNRGITYGLVQGAEPVTAVPFRDYATLYQSDYKIGLYNGLKFIYTPSRGFVRIEFQMTVRDFPTIAASTAQ